MSLNNESYNEWLQRLPIEIEENLLIIKNIIPKINSFDLISFVARYNSIHDSDEYSDYRGDKFYHVSEAVAIQCLKGDYVDNTTYANTYECLEAFDKIQQATSRYCAMLDALENFNSDRKNDLLSQITRKINRDAKHIRNPGHPSHHLYLSKELYKPFHDQIYRLFGFYHSDTIIIRKNIYDFFIFKRNEIDNKLTKDAKFLYKEIIQFKKGLTKKSSVLEQIDDLDEIIRLNDYEIRKKCKTYYRYKSLVQYSDYLTFDSTELSDFFNLDGERIRSFLDTFSLGFKSIPEDSPIYGPNTILKYKPIIKHDGRYVIPSFPLFTWCVEDFYTKTFKLNSKLFGKLTAVKHNFLQKEGLKYFKKLLPNCKVYENIFYEINDDRYETDAVIIYDNYVFVIEAKAIPYSDKSKSGHKLKTLDHLKNIIRDSNIQASRFIELIKNNSAIFYTSNKKKVDFSFNGNEIFKIISLTLESVGSIVPMIKKEDVLGLIDKEYFPWVISIYDLIIIRDFFETPSLLFHYLQGREEFLYHKDASVYEELDLVGYFIQQSGLFLQSITIDKKSEGANYVYFDNETDFINNYYMQKALHRNKFINKPSYFYNKDFKDLIMKIDNSKIKGRTLLSEKLLRYNKTSIREILKKIKLVRKQYKKDKKLHDFSIYTPDDNGFGFTYMVGRETEVIIEKLTKYIKYKKYTLFAETWIGLLEVNGDIKVIKFI